MKPPEQAEKVIDTRERIIICGEIFRNLAKAKG